MKSLLEGDLGAPVEIAHYLPGKEFTFSFRNRQRVCRWKSSAADGALCVACLRLAGRSSVFFGSSHAVRVKSLWFAVGRNPIALLQCRAIPQLQSEASGQIQLRIILQDAGTAAPRMLRGFTYRLSALLHRLDCFTALWRRTALAVASCILSMQQVMWRTLPGISSKRA